MCASTMFFCISIYRNSDIEKIIDNALYHLYVYMQHTRVKQNMEVLEELRAAGDLESKNVEELKVLLRRCNIDPPRKKRLMIDRLQ